MPIPLLSPEEKLTLKDFVDRSPSGTAYLHRAQIMLLADAGYSHEAIAAELIVPVGRVRQLLRAYNREGIGLFPRSLLSPIVFSPEDPIAEAGRKIMANLLRKVMSYETTLVAEIDVTSVHESRKGIRQLRTALRLFEPYYEAGVLRAYRRRFFKFMRRLGRSRDAAVFIYKLDLFVAGEDEAGAISAEQRGGLIALRAYWEAELASANEKVHSYLAKKKFQTLLREFEKFTQNESQGARTLDDPLTPNKVLELAAILIYEKIAMVRVYADQLDGASLQELHVLRIRCKELRHTMDFFEPVVGATAVLAIDTVKTLLTHLGDLNDARIHLEMLAMSDDSSLAPAVNMYRVELEAELARLTLGLQEPWSALEQPSWRLEVAQAIAAL